MEPKELLQLNLENIKAITFDVDGVIVPTGTDIKGNKDGTELVMKTKKPSQKFFENIEKLKKHLWINFSSGRNILYLQELLSPILGIRFHYKQRTEILLL